MLACKKNLLIILLVSIFYFLQLPLYAQADTSIKYNAISKPDTIPKSDTIPKLDSASKTIVIAKPDTVQKRSLDEYLKTRRGFFGKMMKNLTRDTSEVGKANELLRNDIPFQQYQGYVIRRINIKDLRFGTPLSDTARRTHSGLIKFANAIHHTTKWQVIESNLFFKINDTIQPFLMADNEAFLRQLPYAEDATIQVTPVEGSADSADVDVVLKDVFSLGISIASLDLNNTDLAVREDNISGSGNAIVVHGLYDMSRHQHFGTGVEYILRNIGGSFINLDAGYQNYYPSIVGLKEDKIVYTRFTKPLVNRYKHWTYEVDGSYHSTSNMYSNDSLYKNNLRYRYYDADAWIGYNLHATKFTTESEDKKLRKVIAGRVLKQHFIDLPYIYDSNYNWRYASLTGTMLSVTFYRQNFYKSQYIYAFGINEDIPEGLNLTLTTGYIKKESLSRPFLGFNYLHSVFNNKKNYVSYLIRTEGYLNNKSWQDITFFGAFDYFDHLKAMGAKWNQRTFVDIGFAKQINTILNEPLYIDSKYALPAFRNGNVGGSLRATAKVESVFYSPWTLAAFKFAPFVFGDAGLFNPNLPPAPNAGPVINQPSNISNIYTLVGGGLRTRNENLIFGTLELRGYYFLKKNIYNENWRVDISTNITFKYSSQLAQRPDFIEVN